jgi:hypothetical protein
MVGMRRFRSPWLLAFPLMAAGSLAAHAATYRLTLPDPHDRVRVLQATGHSYLDHLPLMVALIAAPALIALSFAVFGAVRGGPRPLAAWPFALLPPLCFVLQEHLERFAHSGTFPWAAGLEGTFLIGLLLQGPFALTAFLLARGLLVGIHAARRAITRCPPRFRPRPPRRGFRRPQACMRRPVALALGHGERGPPSPIRL